MSAVTLLSDFQTWSNGLQKCHRCNRTYRCEKPVKWYCCKKEEPATEPPSLARKAAFLAESLLRFGVSGFKTVSAEEYTRRMEICGGCEHRRGLGCMKCGCNLPLKAQGDVWKCDLGLWDIEESQK